MSVQIRHRDDLPQGGFAGLTEKQLVVDSRLWGSPDAWDGLGNFVYLADANFQPHGQTNMHPHKEVDVISVMMDGRIAHEGSLEHGQSIMANQAQVQRAGGEGFLHNEINPDNEPNRMLQLWVLPEIAGEPAGYKLYDLEAENVTRIYGGSTHQSDTFACQTVLDIARLNQQQSLSLAGEFLAYVARGAGLLNSERVKVGDLVRGTNLEFYEAENDTLVVVVRVEDA